MLQVAEFTETEISAAIANFDFDAPVQFADPIGVEDVADVPTSEWWEITHAAADASYDSTQEVVSEALEVLEDVPRGELLELVEDGDINGATRLFDWRGFERKLATGLNEVFAVVGIRSAADTSLEIGKSVDFDEEAFLKFLAKGARVTAKRIVANTRKAVVASLSRLVRLGFSPFQIRAQLLSLIGLDAQAMNAAINAIAAAKEAGASISSIKKLAADLGEQKRSERLDLIARFENLNVAQAAQEEAVQQHIDVKALKNVVKIWVVVPDDSLCPICNRLRGQRRKKDELFKDPFTGAEYIGPPVHQRCRCGLRYLQARRAEAVGVFIVDIRTPSGEQIILPSGVKVSREAYPDQYIMKARSIPGAQFNPELYEFHQAGKHGQKTHGRKGGKSGMKGASFADDEESLSIASFDGRLATGNTAAERATRESYLRNQEAGMQHMMRDNQWGDPADIRKRDSNFHKEGEFSSVVPEEMNKGLVVRSHVHSQKAANAERIAARMDEKLAHVSTDDLRDARDSANQRFGLTEGGQFSHAEFGPDGPTGKFTISSPDWKEGGVKAKTVDEREAIINDMANGYIGGWAKTADNGFPPATAVQDSADRKLTRDEWGNPSDSYLRSKGLGGSSVTRTAAAEDFRNLAGGKVGLTVDAYVDSTYEETQSVLKSQGITSLVLHRGTGRKDVDLHEKTTYQTSPLSSWSRSKGIADDFGGGGAPVITAVIPADRIFSTAATGAGCYREEEFIVIGGNQEGYAAGGSGDIQSFSEIDLDEDRKSIDWIKAVYADVYLTADQARGFPSAKGVAKRDKEEGAPTFPAVNVFHQAGKHEQKAHGRGGKGGKAGVVLSTGEKTTGILKDDIRLAEDGNAGDVRMVLDAHDAKKVGFGVDGGADPVFVTDDGVVEWDGADEFATAYEKSEFMNEQVSPRVENYADVGKMEQDFNDDYWVSPSSLYHATDGENIPDIESNGLEARNESRGFNNKSVNSSVFTTSEFSEAEYGVYGNSVVEIDTGAMKRDGKKPFVLEEPDVLEIRAESSIANKIGMDYWDGYREDAGSPYTVIVDSSIDPKYLKVVKRDGVSE